MTGIDWSDWALPPRTNLPYDSPSAEDLIHAVQEYLSQDLLPKSSGSDSWKLRIAVNSLKIAIRELNQRENDQIIYSKIMSDLNVTSESELSAKIKEGQLDDELSNLHAQLSEIVQRKLEVANPRYLDTNTDSD